MVSFDVDSAGMGTLKLQRSVSIRQHTSAYVSIRQHASAYVSIRQHTTLKLSVTPMFFEHIGVRGKYTSTKVQKLTRKYTSTKVQKLTPERHANVVEHIGIGHALSDAFSEEQGSIDSKRRVQRIWQHTSAYVSIRLHTSAYVSIRRLYRQ
jgi:hypothetical protein